jgi:2'-5' RNA ligase superfamily
MSLLLLAYPTLSPGDFERIQKFRNHNDGLYYQVVEPHFTLMFPLSGWEIEAYKEEVEKQMRGFKPFDFCLRCATLNKNAFNEYFHVFLVPDEGYSHILKLHYQLCADRFFPHRALEVDYIPHIGIGNSKDPLKCLEMVESWNRVEFAIPGRISTLDIVNYENDTVHTIQRLPLGD